MVQLSEISLVTYPAENGELSTAAAALDGVCCYDYMSWAGLAGQRWAVLWILSPS